MTIDTYRHMLTTRQAHVLEARLQGHTWRTIARALGLHEATVRGHYRAALDAIAKARETP